jgi:acetylglutamate synthase
MFIQTQFKSKCVRDLEDVIIVSKAVKTDNEIVIDYKLCSDGIKENKLVLKRDKSTAEFLKRHGVVHSWRPQDGLIKMFSKNIIATFSNKQVVMEERETSYMWEDIDVSNISALTLAAFNEYDKTPFADKVYSMFYYYLPVGTINRLATIG